MQKSSKYDVGQMVRFGWDMEEKRTEAEGKIYEVDTDGDTSYRIEVSEETARSLGIGALAPRIFVLEEAIVTDIPVLRSQLKRATWMQVAQLQSRLSTCLRRQVGCVLLGTDGRVAGAGYNGSLPGRPHCRAPECGPEARCMRTQHAERNALDHSTGPIETAFVTLEPCLSCLKDLIARGCREVFFLEAYDMSENERTWQRRHMEENGCVLRQLGLDGVIGESR